MNDVVPPNLNLLLSGCVRVFKLAGHWGMTGFCCSWSNYVVYMVALVQTERLHPADRTETEEVFR